MNTSQGSLRLEILLDKQFGNQIQYLGIHVTVVRSCTGPKERPDMAA